MKFSQYARRRRDRAERPAAPGDGVIYVSVGVLFICFTYVAVEAIELFF